MKTYKEFINEAQVRFSKDVYKDKVPVDVLNKLVECDPTLTKSYSNWIVNSYIKSDEKRLFLEDLYKVGKYLELYDKYKKKNLIEKDIFKFKDYKELFKKMTEIGGLGEPTSDENYLLTDKYFINKGEAEVFYDDKNYLVVIPKTYEASKFYANKTEWCTKFPDQYEEYSSKGNLYIIICKLLLKTNYPNRLLQLFLSDNFGDDEFGQFMDKNDEDVSNETRHHFYDIFKDVHNGYYLKYDEVVYNGHQLENENQLFKSVKLSNKWGVIDDKGNEIIPVEYDQIEDYSDGLFGAYLPGGYNGDTWNEGKAGFIDINNKVVIPFKYNEIYCFHEGRAAVRKNKYSWGFITKENKPITKFIYEEVQSFQEERAAVMKNNKWGFINLEGELVIPMIYNYASYFSDGRSWVGTKYINKDGETIHTKDRGKTFGKFNPFKPFENE